jgi:hypothetical protein
MKKGLLIMTLLFIISYTDSNAQFTRGIYGQTNWFYNWTNFKPKTVVYNSPTNILTGIISTNTTLYKKYTYQLVGQVYVTNNAVLNIEAGTVIRGDKETGGALIITKGAKIMAKGEVSDPIVFTSNNDDFERKKGDWGGLVILGSAPINRIGGEGILYSTLDPSYGKYGGVNKEESSGVLNYVRIEFAGKKVGQNKGLSGLLLAGVGSKTKIENIQISYCGSDSFQTLGGAVALNHLVSFRSNDDDFYFSQGVDCTITNSIAIRHPFSSDNDGSRCLKLESYDSPQNMDYSKPFSKILASNITLVNTEANEQGLVKEAISVSENTFLTVENSVISGFKSPILFGKNIKSTKEDLAKISLKNILVNDCKLAYETENRTSDFDSVFTSVFTTIPNKIETKSATIETLFIQSNIKEEADYRLKNNTVVAEN